MSQQAVDLRRSIQLVRRHKILVGGVLLLGIAAGGAYAVVKPAAVTSTALVALPPPAQSEPALSPAEPTLIPQLKSSSRAVIRCS